MIVAALVAVLLQLFIAPHIGLFSAVPNFLLALCVAVAVARPSPYGYILPFALGLLFDFVSGGPLGAMAFSLTAFSTLASYVFTRVDNDSLFMALAVMAGGVLLVNVAYGVFMLVGGLSGSFVDAIIYRIVPCSVYDFVISVIAYLVVARFAKPAGVVRTELTQLR